ncbi:MAG: hypothetical protein IKL08_06090 [Clostridia bacterium]|nr:hypothetical protein [Clostridia bacterium]
MNWFEFILGCLIVVVIGLWGLVYISCKYNVQNSKLVEEDKKETKKKKENK